MQKQLLGDRGEAGVWVLVLVSKDKGEAGAPVQLELEYCSLNFFPGSGALGMEEQDLGDTSDRTMIEVQDVDMPSTLQAALEWALGP